MSRMELKRKSILEIHCYPTHPDSGYPNAPVWVSIVKPNIKRTRRVLWGLESRKNGQAPARPLTSPNLLHAAGHQPPGGK